MTVEAGDSGEHEVIERECALLGPAVRRDPQRVRALLHPDFTEYGASGRIWDRDSIVAVTSGTEQPIAADGMSTTRLGPDAVLLTYRSNASGRHALRSSVWVRDPAAGWLLRFHHGTVTSE